ncbi:hypothetical protein ACFO4O_10185 [Glaciecola siphonariae]|uniref:Secreted protein n=1 Tax=Glaciecola siphonariae TaxID=521012 RepID=A0ABV9LX11_9ALTE
MAVSTNTYERACNGAYTRTFARTYALFFRQNHDRAHPWGIGVVLCFTLMLMNIAPVGASAKCAAANPSSVSDVYECVATASVSLHNNVNPFINTQKAQCLNLKMVYANVLQQHGVARDKVNEKLPTCEVFAKVLLDLNGEPPFWQSCLGYDGSAEHMVKCLTGMATQANSKHKRQLQMLNNCGVAGMMYESILLSLDDTNSMSMPSNYKRPDCDTFLAKLEASQDSVEASPCADFSENNINAHARRCLLSDQRIKQMSPTLTCQTMRQLYQSKLIQTYGKIPEGFRLLACSVLNPIIEEAQALR